MGTTLKVSHRRRPHCPVVGASGLSSTRPQVQQGYAHCLDLHDLWLSKAVAGRPKDRELCVDLRKTGVISDRLLLERLDEIDGLEEAVRAGVRASVTAGRVQH